MTGDDGSGDTDLDGRLQSLHDALVATEERPVTREAGWWLGEAQAVARDLVDRPADPDVLVDRVSRVEELLDHVSGTGDDEADAHLERAREATRETLATVRESTGE